MADIDGLVALEEQLEAKRQEIAAALKLEREELGLSLRQVGREVDLKAPSLLDIERGKHVVATTVARIARFYRQQNSRSRARPTV